MTTTNSSIGQRWLEKSNDEVVWYYLEKYCAILPETAEHQVCDCYLRKDPDVGFNYSARNAWRLWCTLSTVYRVPAILIYKADWWWGRTWVGLGLRPQMHLTHSWGRTVILNLPRFLRWLHLCTSLASCHWGTPPLVRVVVKTPHTSSASTGAGTWTNTGIMGIERYYNKGIAGLGCKGRSLRANHS